MHEALSSSSHPVSPQGVTLRNRGFAVTGGLLLLLPLVIVMVVGFQLLDGVAAGEGPFAEGAWLVILVAGCFGAFFHLLGFHPRLRLSEEGIELRGVLSTTFVPWAKVETLDAEGRGRFVIGLADGGTVDHFHYGASLGGELIRYRHHRRVARRVQAFRDEVGEGAVTDRAAESVTTLPMLPALWIILAFQIPLAVGFVLSFLQG